MSVAFTVATNGYLGALFPVGADFNDTSTVKNHRLLYELFPTVFLTTVVKLGTAMRLALHCPYSGPPRKNWGLA